MLPKIKPQAIISQWPRARRVGACFTHTREADSLKAVYVYTVDPEARSFSVNFGRANELGVQSPAFAGAGPFRGARRFSGDGRHGGCMRCTISTIFSTTDRKPPASSADYRVAPGGYAVSRGTFRSITKGTACKFGIAPETETEPGKDTLPADEKFSLDV